MSIARFIYRDPRKSLRKFARLLFARSPKAYES